MLKLPPLENYQKVTQGQLSPAHLLLTIEFCKTLNLNQDNEKEHMYENRFHLLF